MNLHANAKLGLSGRYALVCAIEDGLTLKAAALKLGFVTEADFDRIVDPKKMVNPSLAAAPATAPASRRH